MLPPGDPSPQSFPISYAGVDRTWAEWIAWALEEAGHRVVIQAWDFRPSSQFPVEMQRAMTECNRMIAVVSPEGRRRRYLQTSVASPPQGRATSVCKHPCVSLDLRILQ